MNYIEQSEIATIRAYEVLKDSGIVEIWEKAGAEVRLVGSLKMGLLAKHRDIDLHVYSSGITESKSFAIASRMAENPKVISINCINGLYTDEKCVSWHLQYKIEENEVWQIDIIHIEKAAISMDTLKRWPRKYYPNSHRRLRKLFLPLNMKLRKTR